jgi:hypothetical protein
VLLAVLGAALVLWLDREPDGLVFLSPEQFEELRAAHRRLATGRALLLAGATLLGATLGLLIGRRGRRVPVRVVALGVVGGGLLAAGVLLRTIDTTEVVAYSGSYEPLICSGCTDRSGSAVLAGRLAGSTGVLGGALLCTWAAARSRRGEQPVDLQ